MKKILLFVTIALSNNVFGQNINIPDDNFKKYLVGEPTINNNGDGEIQVSEATDFTGIIDCSYSMISDLTGIEEFTALTSLRFNGNKLTSLDLSHNTALKSLDCSHNQLTSLDLSQNTNLKELYCSPNQLTSLDLSQNTALKSLDCEWNLLTSLNVSQNTNLKELYCSHNQLTSLNVSQNTDLTSFKCTGNKLTSLNLSQNTALKSLYCSHNQLTSLGLSQNTTLKSLYCSHNQLTSLDLSQNTALKSLDCEYNLLAYLDVSQNTALSFLDCSENKLTSIDLINNNILTSLDSTGFYGDVLFLQGNLFITNSELLALEGFNNCIKAISEYYDGKYKTAIEKFNNSILFDFQEAEGQEIERIDDQGDINLLYKPVRDLQRAKTIAYYYRAKSKLKLKKYEEAIKDYSVVISRNDSVNYLQGSMSGQKTVQDQPYQDVAYYSRGWAKKKLNLPYELDFYKSCEMGYKIACYEDSSKKNKIKLPEAQDSLKISFTNGISKDENLIFSDIEYHFSYYKEIKASSITSKYKIVRFRIKNTCIEPQFSTKYYNCKYKDQWVKYENDSFYITLLNFNKINYIKIYEGECGIDNIDIMLEFFNIEDF